MFSLSKEQKQKFVIYAKWVALIGLPALATLWLTLSGTWGVDPVISQRIAATITSVDVFLGTILGVSEQKVTQTMINDIKGSTAALEQEIMTNNDTSDLEDDNNDENK